MINFADFVFPILCAGVGISIFLGPMGCFLLWQRIAFFGDSLAHSVFLGAALGIILKCDYWGVIIVCVIMALLVNRFNTLSSDAGLALTSYGTMAVGLLLLQKVTQKLDPSSYLFGDILAINYADVLVIFLMAITFIFYLQRNWHKLLLWTLDKDLAITENIAVNYVSRYFFIFLAVAIALSLKIVGALLVPALLIIPAATSRYIASTPKSMILLSMFMTLLSIKSGILLGWWLEAPTGPTIVVAALLLFLVVKIVSNFFKSK